MGRHTLAIGKEVTLKPHRFALRNRGHIYPIDSGKMKANCIIAEILESLGADDEVELYLAEACHSGCALLEVADSRIKAGDYLTFDGDGRGIFWNHSSPPLAQALADAYDSGDVILVRLI